MINIIGNIIGNDLGSGGGSTLTIVSVASIDAVDVPYGTDVNDLNLQSTVIVTLSDSSTTEVSINWVTTNYDELILDTYSLNGELILPVGVTNPLNLVAEIDVTVVEAEVESVEVQTEIDVVYDTAFASVSKPATVNVTLNSGYVEVIDVSWAAGSYDPQVIGDFISIGTLINLPTEVLNTGGITAALTLTVLDYDDSAQTPAPALFQAAGTLVGGTSASVVWPTHVANDIGVLMIEQTTADAAIGTISGWTQVTGSPVEEGTGSTQTRLSVYIRRATSSSEANVAIASSDHVCGVIVTFRGVYRHPLVINAIDAVATSIKVTASTATSITGLSNNQDANDILYIAARGSDVATARYSAEADASLTGIVERVDLGTAVGNGGGIGAWTGNLAGAGASGTFTATLASTSSEAYLVLAFKGINNYSAPAVQASNLVFSGDRKTTWTKSGAGTVVLYNESGTINGSFLPVDGEVYEAGDVLGGGNTVMYVGAANNAMKFARFSYATTVAIRAFAYNVTGIGPEYNVTTAANNPITPTTPSDPVFYLSDAITESERNEEHPEITLRGASKAYPIKTFTINGYRIVFYVMDNNGSASDGGATLWKYDQIYMLYQLESEDPRDPAAWTVFEDGGVPWAILSSAGNVPPNDNWHVGQNWIAGMNLVSDPDEVWLYVYAQGGAITSFFNFGRAVCDFTDFPNTVPTVTYDAAAMISQSSTQSSFQGGDVIFHSGISRWVALIPNRASLSNGVAHNGRADTLEVWLSANGTTGWSRIATDIIQDLPINWGGWCLNGNVWIDSDRIHLIASETDLANYRSNEADDTDTVYKYLNKDINEISFAISLSAVSDVRIENVLWENDYASCLGVNPASGYIDFGGEQHIIVGAFNLQGVESGPGQVPMDVRVLTTAPRTGAVVVNRNAFRPGLTRYLKCSRVQITQASDPGTVNDTIGDTVPSGGPYDEVTETLGTVHGTPTISILDQAALSTVSDYFSFASHTHDTENIGIKTTFFTTDFTTIGISAKEGTFELWIDADGKLNAKIYGPEGYLQVKSTASFNSLHTNMFREVMWAGFITDKPASKITIKLCAGCTTNVPVTTVHDDNITAITQNSNVIKLGNVTAIGTNAPKITAQTWTEGAEATEANWLKDNYN